MILVNLPARIVCDEPACTVSSPVQLCLTVAGTFAAKPPAVGAWQVSAAENGTFITRCEKHSTQIQTPRLVIPDIQKGH